jgi:hypothetical protein
MIQLPTSSLGSLKQFLKTHRDLMFKYIVQEIGKGVKSNAESIDLFQFGESRFVAGARKPEFGILLQQALDYFISEEMFEEAAPCRDLLRSIYGEIHKQRVEEFLKDMDKIS